jgi:molecular chaperone GrpE
MEKNIKKELKECQEKRDEYLGGWKRAKAEFLNYKKEENKRNQEIARYTEEEIISEILPVLDNLEKAKENLSDQEKNQHIKGFLQIERQLKNYLKEKGLKEIESVGEKFNPEYHEAIQVVEGKEPNIVLEEVVKGYKLKGRVLRPAKVKVTKT